MALLIAAHTPTLLGALPVDASPHDIVTNVVAHENEEMRHKGAYVYLSQERSERTGGHLWTERVAETPVGKIRMLVAVDGQKLSGTALETERERIQGIVTDPDAFQRRAKAAKDDEVHAQAMLNLLPKAFVFANKRSDGDYIKIDFKPNPDYEPQSIEQRVLHGMSGTIVIDPRSERLHRLEARLPEDVNIGLGVVVKIKAGSNFSTTRDAVPGDEWKTAVVDTDIDGRALFFGTIGKKEHAEHSAFERLPVGLTVAQTTQFLMR